MESHIIKISTTKRGLPLAVNNLAMRNWKTVISKIQKGEFKDENGKVVDTSNTTIRVMIASNDQIANIKATSNNMSKMSNIELSSRGLSTTETGEVIISNKSKFNKFVKTYKENANKITSEPNLQSDLQIIDSIEEGISLTVNELDVLFKYIYDPYGIEVKQGEKISKIKGPGIYVTFANSNGDIYSFDINNNLATTNPTGGQIKVLSTLNTPYSSEKNRFLDNFAAYVSEDLNLPYSMRFLELVEYYKQINPDVEDVDIILSVKDVNGNSKTFTLAEINELDDSLLQSELNHPC
jgi:hypothetical protein